VIADYDPRITLTEWWEEGGTGLPYTFFCTLPLDGAFDDLATASFATELYRDLTRVKPARAHFQLRQQLRAKAPCPWPPWRAHGHGTHHGHLIGPDPADDLKITTEYGEPLEGDDGAGWEYI
jgi:P2-related tail formation protein